MRGMSLKRADSQHMGRSSATWLSFSGLAADKWTMDSLGIGVMVRAVAGHRPRPERWPGTKVASVLHRSSRDWVLALIVGTVLAVAIVGVLALGIDATGALAHHGQGSPVPLVAGGQV